MTHKFGRFARLLMGSACLAVVATGSNGYREAISRGNLPLLGTPVQAIETADAPHYATREVLMAQTNNPGSPKAGEAVRPQVPPGTTSPSSGMAPRVLSEEELNAARLRAKPAEQTIPAPPAGGPRSDGGVPVGPGAGGDSHAQAGSPPHIPQSVQPPLDQMRETLKRGN